MNSGADPSRISMVDLAGAHSPLEPDLQAAFTRVLRSGRFILGEEIDAFEREVAAALGVEHAIACSSGTDALLAALMALELEPGDEVLCPSFTFFATGGCVWRLGARPVFVEVSAESWNAEREHFEARMGPRTRAIVPVHLFGRLTDMEPILDLGRRHGVPVIEDAAQALGATDRGRQAGTFGELGCFSFFPTKNLGGFGDGGLVAATDAALAVKVRSLRNHGQSSRYIHERVGGNFRLDALQAALLRVKLPHVPAMNERRRQVAARYGDLFVAAGLVAGAGPGDGAVDSDLPVALPQPAGAAHVFHQYVIRVLPEGARDLLRRELDARGIETQIYYPVPLHLQPCFSSLGYRVGDLPTTEQLANQVLALPMHPDLTAAQQERVVGEIARALGRGGRAAAAPASISR
jgi:dTDP-4-amino-4,6-dideoxygalactose transaminase